MRTCITFSAAALLAGLSPLWLAAAEPALPLAGVEQVVAHRGSSADRPQNTLASARRAIEAGATAVEVDVRTTQDGYLVLRHDAELAPTTDGQGAVGEFTLDQIKRLDAGSWFGAAYKNERVPTLAEALAVCRAKVDVLLDLKEQGEVYDRRVAAEINRHGEPRRTIVGVRSIAQAKQFRSLLPDARQLGLIAKPAEIEAYAAAGVETIRLWPMWLSDKTLVDRVRKSGAKLHLNGTTGLRNEVQELLVHRPDSLSSDDPARLIATLKEIDARQ